MLRERRRSDPPDPRVYLHAYKMAGMQRPSFAERPSRLNSAIRASVVPNLRARFRLNCPARPDFGRFEKERGKRMMYEAIGTR